MDLFNYQPRRSHEVHIGNKPLGGQQPLRLQSMTTTLTTDTEASVAQCIAIIEAGADYVRLTTQGVREAENLRPIREALHRRGYDTPLVADVHFNPKVADVAAGIVEKVRINPGNYVDPARTFKELEYTDEEYAAELARLEERFVQLLDICRAHGTAVRIGVNHGSLSDRIMCRYGDTPAGIVESCMEFLRVCAKVHFDDVVISIKASNTVVMVQSVRLLVDAMRREKMDFPLHLGVTEAGEGEDGRIKEKRKISLFPRKTVRVKVGKALDIASLVEDASPEAKHTRTELGVVTDAMLDAITAELEKIRGEKAPEGRWNPRTKRREAPGTPSGPVGGALGEPDEK